MTGRRAARALLTAVTLTAVTLTACRAPAAEPSDTTGRTASLWAARTAYVGDNARVAALVSAAGFGAEGTYRLALQTGEPPYGVTVAFQHLNAPFERVDVSTDATLLLGLVANLDHVTVTFGEHTYALTAARASQELGYDVKELGRDEGRLTAYVNAHQR